METELVSRAKEGDTGAFEQLVLQNQQRVYNLALRMTGNTEDAFDLSQEAFIRAYRGLVFFNMESSFSTWLYRLTSNVCIDFLRKEKKRKTVSLTFLSDDDSETELPDLRMEPSGLVEKRELHEQIEAAINNLPVEFRQIIVLREMEGLSYMEISDALDIKEGTVKSRISRAREALRKTLSSGGNIFSKNSSYIGKGGETE